MSQNTCDFSLAEKSYRAASIARDHLDSGIVCALPHLHRAVDYIDFGGPGVRDELRAAIAELAKARDYAESVR